MPQRIILVESCCICVPDLKIAAAIIAVLGIVTSPAVSWAVVRHSYVIRVSCYLSTSKTRADLIDVNLNNVLSFGFGANAGLAPSCLSHLIVSGLSDDVFLSDDASTIVLYVVIEYFGWFVFLVDVIFVFACVCFLIKIFRGGSKRATLVFLWTAIMAICLSFIYGMLYVSACVSIGGAFPLFEFAFCIIDMLLWVYFLIVVNSYRDMIARAALGPPSRPHLCTILDSECVEHKEYKEHKEQNK